ncbi:MAG: hypothetical protein GF355_01735, partial [Candidatus Eisenbacteria bacterium]|nr:hypothetical protein [Candidatus Eisenbacteria bacterium]
MKRALLGGLLALIGTAQWQCLLIPNDEPGGHPAPNEPPHVRITGGVFTSDFEGVDYRVEFKWHGWDNDGAVSGFEWAVDDTTLEDAWTFTKLFRRDFAMRATTYDPGEDNFYDWHTFFIRAIDNDFVRSKVAKRFFNSRNVAPRAEITFPLVSEGNLIVRRPRSFNITWEGEDLDSPEPEKLPEFYEYKLVRVDLQVDPVYALLNYDNVFLDTLTVGDRSEWIRVPGDVTGLRLLELDVPEVFVFGVRAVDLAGAVEPDLDEAENYFRFNVTDEECQPIVEVSEPNLGLHVFPEDGEVWRVSVPSKTPVRFRWSGDAAYCGSRPGNVNYGLDIPDPGDETISSP